MLILAIDPGTTQSGYCELWDGSVSCSGVIPNHDLLAALTREQRYDALAIEWIESMGMAVGREVFETCRWIGRFQQVWKIPESVLFVSRRSVKLHICGTMKAKDKNIRQALIDRFGPPGTGKNPGGTYGVKSHAWSALAVAAMAYDKLCGDYIDAINKG